MSLRVHPQIASLTPYSPGKPLSELERELGISQAIKLASNENPWGPSSKALQVLEAASASLHRYPDGGAHYLRQMLAERFKIDDDQVLVGNGSDEIISLLVRTFLSPGDEAIMADLTFVMYKLAVLGGHGVPVEVPLKHWTHDMSAMVEAVSDRTRLFFLCNPNNPTGTMLKAKEIDPLLKQLPDHVVIKHIMNTCGIQNFLIAFSIFGKGGRWSCCALFPKSMVWPDCAWGMDVRQKKGYVNRAAFQCQ